MTVDLGANASTDTKPTENARLYSLQAITTATIIGSFLAGGFLVARNFKESAQLNASRNVMILTVIGLIGFGIVIEFMPELEPKQNLNRTMAI